MFPVTEEGYLINVVRDAKLEIHHFASPSINIDSGKGHEWRLKSLGAHTPIRMAKMKTLTALIAGEAWSNRNSHSLQMGTQNGAVSQFLIKLTILWASLVAQWLRICLPMQGTRVRALVWEDPTCRGATGPVSHNY